MLARLARRHGLRRQALRGALLIVLGTLLIRTAGDRSDTITRELAVDFSGLHETGKRSLWQPDAPVRHSNGSYIDDRYRYERTLKAGNQGSVYIYTDLQAESHKLVVLKTISAPSRNAVPEQLLPVFQNITTTWPSEIEASLAVTGASYTESGGSPYVPVYDYFVLRGTLSESSDWKWALVTPWVSGGILPDLAKDLRSVGRTAEIDRTYRPAFNTLLADLQSLHSKGYCHDDVKPQNIFVESPQRWLLGDLGNTREVAHPWHTTRLWHRHNQWADCQQNDVRRMLKSYLSFLREASHDREQFDVDFLGSNTPWSQMYWDFVSDRSPAASLLTSWTYAPSDAEKDFRDHSLNPVACSVREALVRQELLCTELWWKLWFMP